MSDLFGSWIEQTRQLQIDSYGVDPSAKEGQERVQYVKDNVLAAEDELHEMLAELSWKPWASAEFFNREQFIAEGVDLLFFVGILLAAAQCTDEELNTAYQAKMEKNRLRMIKGYTGLNKCPKCRRAFDDVAKSEDLDICVLCEVEEEIKDVRSR